MTEVENTALRLLAMREHSRTELRRKLRRKYAIEEIEPLLDALADKGVQSEERFTEQYVSMRRGRGYGPLHIQAELRERGISGQLIAAFVDPYDEEWLVLAREVAYRKFGSAPVTVSKEKARRGRFLEQRGFSTEIIWKTINNPLHI